MITLVQGDILRSGAEALVNTVNCVGVMGRGIALQFKKAFPQNFRAYASACSKGLVLPGAMFVYELPQNNSPRFIVNFPTKRHWKERSRMEDIEEGLHALAQEILARDIRSIAIPPLGCGLGGLDWNQVRARIEDIFQDLPEVQVLLYEPKGAPLARNMVKQASPIHMTPGRAALLGLMRQYLRAVMAPYVSLLEIHKFMYFMQEAGENLRLRYVKAPYGPYAENLRHVLNAIEGHFILGYADGDDTPDKEILPLAPALEQAGKFLENHRQTQARLEQVARLIEGFETPYGMELISTVHWVATREHATSPGEAIAKFHAWNVNKHRFDQRHIHIAWDVLSRQNWIAQTSSQANEEMI